MIPNKENIRKWVDALRSGEYKQGHHVLGNEETGLCCLGVACIISPFGYNPSDTHLPAVTQRWLGLDVRSPDVTLYDDPKHRDSELLVNLNDGAFHTEPLTFIEIADLIEKEYLNV